MDQTCFLLTAISFMSTESCFLGLKKENYSFISRAHFATADHNTPTINQHLPVEDALSANQLKAFRGQCCCMVYHTVVIAL
jgi:hypothetical protein